MNKENILFSNHGCNCYEVNWKEGKKNGGILNPGSRTENDEACAHNQWLH